MQGGSLARRLARMSDRMPERIVIVGASLTGGSAAVALRAEGYEGTITLIGAEDYAPYERPPLSKDYLRGETPFEKAYVKPPSWYDENKIDTRYGTPAESIDTKDRAVVLAGGERVPYDAALIATGSRNRTLSSPGADLENVLSLRSIDDSNRIREAAKGARTAVVVGMGFIGAECAASLRALGVEVTAVEPAPTPLFRVLGADIGAALGALHADNGVTLLFDDVVEKFEGSGRVEAAVTRSGKTLPCDIVVYGVGIDPATDVAAGTDIAIDNGIVVDELCRTNVEGVYAAGDVANHYHPIFGRHLRVEHWQNAMRHGTHAAKSILGATDPYTEIHWFWSDQYDANLQYAGHHREWDSLAIRGSLEERSFVAFYIKDGLIEAAVALNRGKELRRAMGLIKARKPVPEETLRDEDVDLKTLSG
jgi:3-phenylpropionate/trans-cinnamate dioxygenase ferredoxin reductase component